MADVVFYGPAVRYRIPRPGENVQMWSLVLKVRPNGSIDLASVSDGIPAGEIEVRGHDDGNRVTLNVRQRDERGRFVASAQHTRDRAEEELEKVEELAESYVPAGYQGAAQHTYTTGCDGFHDPGQCPGSDRL
jgi:hypothetical protein